MKELKSLATLLSLGFAIFSTGCAHSPHPWGERTTMLPSWQSFGEAAIDAMADPHTWVPLIVAGVFTTGDLDQEVTEWAVEEDLLFVSTQSADEHSDDWLEVSEWLVYSSALATPSGDEPVQWVFNKSKGLIATGSIIFAGNQIPDIAKKPFDRERPDGSNNNSFPSAHAIRASMRATMAARNIDQMPLRKGAKYLLQGGVYGLAGLTAWARLEANKHHPSDVLVGYSLGHFFGAFLNDAFITPETGYRFLLETGNDGSGWQLKIEGHF